jgi:stage V sporulation protein R
MHTPYDTNLPPHLRSLKEEIEGYARGYGLDFYETIFEVIDADDLNEVAAYGGFPTRYPHWSFGMAYEELRKGYDYGLSKIYEMVINNDPCYAYLMRSNHTVDQKLVMSHVYGHCDFFKNNAYFRHTNRKMMDEMANHGARIRHYVEKYGEDEVEAFMDRCMSIDDLIDVHSTAIRRREDVSRYDFTPERDDSDQLRPTRFKSKDYMDDYINPRDLLKKEEEERRKAKEQTSRSFPEHPEKDVLLFLIEHAPLKNWQRDILEIVRDEAYYFAPQGQTKICNEGWACATFDSLVYSDRGLLRLGQVVEQRMPVLVSDGQSCRRVYDWAKFADRETVWVRTRRGLELEGSVTHRLLLPDDSWRRMDELRVGDRLLIQGGANLWAEELVRVHWTPDRARTTLQEVAAQVGVDIETVIRYRRGVRGRYSDKLAVAVLSYDQDLAAPNRVAKHRRAIRVPDRVDEQLASFFGYLIGDGHISKRKRTIGLTTGDESQADRFVELVQQLFELSPLKKWDRTKWRVCVTSKNLEDFLVHLGFQTGICARIKDVPDVILRSPKSVVASFLRAYYDCDGYAGPCGVILSTSSESMSKTVQLLLIDFGILSTRRPHKDGCWHVETKGKSAELFMKEIGFGLDRKQEALRTYVEQHQWFKKETWEDEIVAIERRRADVYDISVEETHRYAAQGFINHNSYWHSTIMTQKALTPSEVIDFADHHSGTMAVSRGRINPYKLGIELLRDIEHRWNTGKFGKEYEECEDLEKRRNWDRQLGLGRQKIFEVRRIHNDITFIDTFLTPEFCVQHNMFTFAWQEQAGQYIIESREFEKIKQRLLFSLTNFGKPWIYVVDGNYRNRGELLLRHQHTGVELRLDQAADTLANIQFIWGRPVHLQTAVDGKPTMLSFDGTEHSIKTGGEIDDSRRSTPAKTR